MHVIGGVVLTNYSVCLPALTCSESMQGEPGVSRLALKMRTKSMQCGRGAATQVMSPGEVEADLLPPLGQRRGHARGAHNGTDVDIDARCDGPQGSHIVICIHGSPRHLRNRTVEYVTDDSTLDSAVSTGFEIARAVIDGRQS